MKIELCKTNDSFNVLGKTITKISEIEITLRKDFDSVYPSLILSTDVSFNYVIIPSLNKKYYLDNIEIIANRIKKYSFKLDVLETYKDNILSSTIQADSTNVKMPGVTIQTTDEVQTEYVELTTDMNKQSILLVALGS